MVILINNLPQKNHLVIHPQLIFLIYFTLEEEMIKKLLKNFMMNFLIIIMTVMEKLIVVVTNIK